MERILYTDVTPAAVVTYDLKTPFGQLYQAVNGAVDSAKAGSAVFEMNAAAGLCGLPQFNGQ